MDRGSGRGLQRTDFAPGAITRFTPAALGSNWQKIHALAAYRLDEFLGRMKTPARITSTFRTPDANRAAAGASTSRHLPDSSGLSNAFDVWFTDSTFFAPGRAESYMRAARLSGFNGVGFYKGKPLVHVDVRPSPWSWLGEKIQTADGRKTMRFYPRDQIFAVLAGSTGVAAIAIAIALAAFLARRQSS